MIRAVVRRPEGLVSGNWELTTKWGRTQGSIGGRSDSALYSRRGDGEDTLGAMVYGRAETFNSGQADATRAPLEGSRSEVDV